jgi:hypothetical protein
VARLDQPAGPARASSCSCGSTRPGCTCSTPATAPSSPCEPQDVVLGQDHRNPVIVMDGTACRCEHAAETSRSGIHPAILSEGGLARRPEPSEVGVGWDDQGPQSHRAGNQAPDRPADPGPLFQLPGTARWLPARPAALPDPVHLPVPTWRANRSCGRTPSATSVATRRSAAQRVQLVIGYAAVRDVSGHSVDEAFLRPAARVPLEPAHPAVAQIKRFSNPTMSLPVASSARAARVTLRSSGCTRPMNGRASSSSCLYPRMRANAGLTRLKYPSNPAM